MEHDHLSLLAVVSEIVDNRGRTCPVADSGMPLIATNCIRNEALYPTYDNVRYVSNETFRTWFRGHPKPGDILFVNKGTPGRVCMVPDPIDFCIAQDMVALRANPAVVYPPYLFAVLRSPQVQDAVERMHVGTLIPHFKKGDFDKLLLPIPRNRKVQKFIGDCYLNLSAKIDLNRKTARVLEGIARAVFTSWFVNFDPVRRAAAGQPTGLPADLAVLFSKRLVDSPIGEVPEGWRVLPLSAVFDVNPTRSLKKGATAPYLDMSDMPTHGHAPAEWVQREAGSGMRFVNGDTLVARITPCLENGKTAFVDFLADGEVAWGSTEYIVLRPKAPLVPVFAYLLARDERFRTHAIQAMTGSSGRQRVPVESLDHFQIAVPSMGCEAIAGEFAVVVEPLFARMSVAMKQNRTLAALRDALLPKLISGELRIADAEKIVGRTV